MLSLVEAFIGFFSRIIFIGDDGKDLIRSGDDLNSNEVARCFFVN
jgi:hypothetical protein